jgi:hypothetical protein
MDNKNHDFGVGYKKWIKNTTIWGSDAKNGQKDTKNGKLRAKKMNVKKHDFRVECKK